MSMEASGANLPVSYHGPTAQLLELGRQHLDEPHDYLPMGFTSADIPQLLDLAQNEALGWLPPGADGEPVPQVYAPVHAWRVLGQLKAAEAIPMLLGLLHQIDDDDDDFVDTEIPDALAQIGAPAIEPCRGYLLDASHPLYARIAAAHAIQENAQLHPEGRSACLDALMAALREYTTSDPVLNAFLVSYLADMKAVEADALARQAFEADRVDLQVMGDYEDFEVAVGLLAERTSPRDLGRWKIAAMPGLADLASELIRSERLQEKKKKEKRKQAKKARKRHRRK